MRRAVSSWGPALLLMALIFALSSREKLPEPPGLLGFDKLHHVIAYAALAGLVFRAARMVPLARCGPYPHAFAISVLYGLLDEWHQGFVPGRSAEIADLAADALGAGLALGAVFLVSRYFDKGIVT